MLHMRAGKYGFIIVLYFMHLAVANRGSTNQVARKYNIKSPPLRPTVAPQCFSLLLLLFCSSSSSSSSQTGASATASRRDVHRQSTLLCVTWSSVHFAGRSDVLGFCFWQVYALFSMLGCAHL
jgi:hypothetical protein